MLLQCGDDVCFAPKVTAFLRAIFEDAALAFQTLHFEVGSTQAIHQDTAYVVVAHEPLKLIASWIALQDVEPGSGELVYYSGGHRIPEYQYANGESKHWNVQRDGQEVHNGHLRYLKEQIAARKLPEGRFRPKKGDVLFWHADLPHGGSPITSPGDAQAVPCHALLPEIAPAALLRFYSDGLACCNRRTGRQRLHVTVLSTIPLERGSFNGRPVCFDLIAQDHKGQRFRQRNRVKWASEVGPISDDWTSCSSIHAPSP